MNDLLALLLDEEPIEDDIEALKQSIRKNIHMLISSRRCLPGDDQQSINALYVYGLSSDYKTPDSYSNKQLCLEIEQLLAIFEKRLVDVCVTAENSIASEGLLQLRIEGVMRGSSLRPITFDSVFNLIFAQLSFEELSFV
ncbi:MAG: GPW/gp25 family protein [Endozoicomonas sp. (ex Botrylloides leachii)]|nr:GPW/gp25 family protein [Endozoicomonas sp. (ex Botrylloides leachii)]